MPMLASDLINPAFVGAKDPDSMLAVEFYYGIVKNMRGQPVLEKDGTPRKIPYVRISIPGNDTFMVDVPVREEHKRRFSRQWQYWQIQENQGDASGVPGWSIDEWPELNDEQRRELKFLRFSVVEQVAGASDMQVQRMGLNGQALRSAARVALKKRAEEMYSKELQQRDTVIRELQEKDKQRDEEMAAIRDQMAQLMKDNLEEAAAPDGEHAPRRRGRPPKQKAEDEAA